MFVGKLSTGCFGGRNRLNRRCNLFLINAKEASKQSFMCIKIIYANIKWLKANIERIVHLIKETVTIRIEGCGNFLTNHSSCYADCGSLSDLCRHTLCLKFLKCLILCINIIFNCLISKTRSFKEALTLVGNSGLPELNLSLSNLNIKCKTFIFNRRIIATRELNKVDLIFIAVLSQSFNTCQTLLDQICITAFNCFLQSCGQISCCKAFVFRLLHLAIILRTANFLTACDTACLFCAIYCYAVMLLKTGEGTCRQSATYYWNCCAKRGSRCLLREEDGDTSCCRNNFWLHKVKLTRNLLRNLINLRTVNFRTNLRLIVRVNKAETFHDVFDTLFMIKAFLCCLRSLK